MGLSDAYLWSRTAREYRALREVYEHHFQDFVDMYAGLQTTLHAAWFKHPGGGRFSPEMFGGRPPRPATIEDVIGRQTVEEKMSIMRSNLRAAGAAAEKRRALESAKEPLNADAQHKARFPTTTREELP